MVDWAVGAEKSSWVDLATRTEKSRQVDWAIGAEKSGRVDLDAKAE